MTSTCFNAQTRNIVAEVANQLGAVVTLGAWDGQGVVCIANASGNRTERVLADEVHISRHASALGKLLMAQPPWPKVQERIDRNGLPALTENSVSDINILRAQLISARDATTLPPNTVKPSPGSPTLPRCRSACHRQGKP